jgi:hypothetical protein
MMIPVLIETFLVRHSYSPPIVYDLVPILSYYINIVNFYNL